MRVLIEASELYPYWSIEEREPQGEYDRAYEIDEDLLVRYTATQAAFFQVQRELRNIVDPPCPECGHPKSGHKEWTYGEWGCLFVDYTLDMDLRRTCRCQYGIPADYTPPNEPRRLT